METLAKRLAVWSEIAGTMEAIRDEDGVMIACLNSGKIVIPEEMAEELKPYRGRRIAVLRSDSGYHIRELEPIPVEHITLEVHLNRIPWKLETVEVIT